MNTNLENLIEKIKTEGVSKGKEKSDEIIKNAKRQAESIISEAKKEAEGIKQNAEAEAKKKEENAKGAIQQAGRDTVLMVKEKLTDLFDRVLRRNIKKELSPDFMAGLIRMLVDSWKSDKSETFEVLVSEKDKQELAELVLSGAREDLKDIVEIKVSDNISKGFRIGLKGEDVYYDFSDESIAESLRVFLNSEISKIIEEKNG